MSKELAKTKSNEVATFNEEALSQWDNEASSNDVVIPKLIIMQANSTLVNEDKAAAGDVIESLNKEVLAGYKKSIEIVPFYMHKTWIVKKYNPQKDEFDFVKYENVEADNENLDKDFEINGEKYQRQLSRNFYCLIGDNPIPYIVPFKGMSTRAGKILATAMYVQNKAKKLPPPGQTFKLSTTKESYENRINAVFKVEPSHNTSHDKVLECLTWLKMIKEGAVREDNNNEHLENEAPKNTSVDSAPMF